jgi:hypothetical protein
MKTSGCVQAAGSRQAFGFRMQADKKTCFLSPSRGALFNPAAQSAFQQQENRLFFYILLLGFLLKKIN